MQSIGSRACTRLPGISFVCRARDEAAVIEQSLHSLRGLTVPHEIIVVCHLCTDATQAIAEKVAETMPAVRVVRNDTPVSRAGYETLATPCDHPSSIAAYVAACFKLAKHRWLFKWDADFVAQPGLIEFLNTGLDLECTASRKYSIPAQMGEDPALHSREFYLMNNLMGFGKYVFWEVGIYESPMEALTLPEGLLKTLHYKVLKQYWSAPPWFAAGEPSASDIATCHQAIVGLLGPEPLGMARAMNPECSGPLQKALRMIDALKAVGAHIR